MWRRRGKRCSQLSRQLALARLEDALGRVDEAQHQAQHQAGEPAAGSAEGQSAAAAADPAAVSVPAPRASWPGWLFSRAQDKTTQRETSDRGAAGQAPGDSRPRRI
jgi:hypothetical protein